MENTMSYQYKGQISGISDIYWTFIGHIKLLCKMECRKNDRN